MRSMGLLAVLLLLIACKPISRPPVSGLEAIGDDNLTLGMVPVKNNSGVRAYRLLVCRKSASYPKWMLEDSNRCRAALLDQDSSEVVFLQDDLERDFATKYVGYGKGFILPALIGAGAVTIGASAAATGVGAGKWVINKGFDHAKGGWSWVRSTFDNVSGKVLSVIPERLRIRPIGAAGVVKYRASYESAFRQYQIAQTTNKALPQQLGVTITGMKNAATEQGGIYAAALKLRSLEVEKSSLRSFEKMSADKHANYVKGLETRNEKIVENGLNSEQMETWRIAAEGGNTNSWNVYLDKLPNLNEFNRNRFIIDNANDSGKITARINSLDGEITTAREALQGLKDNRKHTIIAGMPVSEMSKARWGAVAGVGAATGIGATVVGTATDTITSATQTLIDLDRSLWGYSDRQTSMYWSQVFREGDMQDARKVQDLRSILGAFAETFGYKVNEDVFALGG